MFKPFPLILITLIATFALTAKGAWPLGEVGDANGGTNCLVCTLLTGVVWQLNQLYDQSTEDTYKMMCGWLKTAHQDILHDACIGLTDTIGVPLAKFLKAGLNPDEACFAVGICNDQDGPMCRLFPIESSRFSQTIIDRTRAHTRHTDDKDGDHDEDDDDESVDSQKMDAIYATIIEGLKKIEKTMRKEHAAQMAYLQSARNGDIADTDLCNVTGVKALCEIFGRWGNDHYPVDDFDEDRYSQIPEMRGWMWRGRDCKDDDPFYYPGAKRTDRDFDTNCNGIYGADNVTGEPYEDMLCEGTGQMGTAVLGDSAGAHFRLPPAWLNVTQQGPAVFESAEFILLNEFDWPQLSATTAFYNSTEKWSSVISGPVSSLYMYMLERNRCNFKDYQNLGVNGARSSAMARQLDETIARSSTKDHPVLVLFELIGNDVCSGHPDMTHMTTPQEFYQNNLKTFTYLDSRLPFGSKILAMGLANGSVLYPTMHDRIHPIGALNNDVTYKAVYDYMNCLLVSPCFGWMNSNATWRERTTQRAMELSETLKELTLNNSFTNITVKYIDCPINEIIRQWTDNGGEAWQLIEPSDGFHPDQLGNALIADFVWNEMLTNISDFVPPVNMHNEKIIELFGDQGGYS